MCIPHIPTKEKKGGLTCLGQAITNKIFSTNTHKELGRWNPKFSENKMHVFQRMNLFIGTKVVYIPKNHIFHGIKEKQPFSERIIHKPEHDENILQWEKHVVAPVVENKKIT